MRRLVTMLVVGGLAVGAVAAPALAAKDPVATWQGGGKSSKPAKYTTALVTQDGDVAVFVSSFKIKGNPNFNYMPKKPKDWSFTFTITADPASHVVSTGTFGPSQVTGASLNYKKGSSMPVNEWGTITVSTFIDGRIAGNVDVDDNWMSVTTKFSGPYKNADY